MTLNHMKPATDIVWGDDWETSVRRRIQLRYHTSLDKWLESRPTSGLVELADELGVPNFQLALMQLKDAEKAGKIRTAAMDSLCRWIWSRMPSGWQIGPEFSRDKMRAFSTWGANMVAIPELRRLDPQVNAVMAAFNCAKIPKGWSPTGVNDPVLIEIFELGWPVTIR